MGDNLARWRRESRRESRGLVKRCRIVVKNEDTKNEACISNLKNTKNSMDSKAPLFLQQQTRCIDAHGVRYRGPTRGSSDAKVVERPAAASVPTEKRKRRREVVGAD